MSGIHPTTIHTLRKNVKDRKLVHQASKYYTLYDEFAPTKLANI